MKLSHAIVEKIKSVGSADEVLAIAKECNVEITPEEANKYFYQIHSGELSDDELDGVAGGYACSSGRVGDTVRVTSGETCSTCGSDIGIVEKWGTLGDRVVLCKTCNKVIGFEGDITFKKI